MQRVVEDPVPGFLAFLLLASIREASAKRLNTGPEQHSTLRSQEKGVIWRPAIPGQKDMSSRPQYTRKE